MPTEVVYSLGNIVGSNPLYVKCTNNPQWEEGTLGRRVRLGGGYAP